MPAATATGAERERAELTIFFGWSKWEDQADESAPSWCSPNRRRAFGGTSRCPERERRFVPARGCSQREGRKAASDKPGFAIPRTSHWLRNPKGRSSGRWFYREIVAGGWTSGWRADPTAARLF